MIITKVVMKIVKGNKINQKLIMNHIKIFTSAPASKHRRSAGDAKSSTYVALQHRRM